MSGELGTPTPSSDDQAKLVLTDLDLDLALSDCNMLASDVFSPSHLLPGMLLFVLMFKFEDMLGEVDTATKYNNVTTLFVSQNIFPKL